MTDSVAANGPNDVARSRNRKEKANLTTKDTKMHSKFNNQISIRTLRGLRDLRGEKIFYQVLHP